MRLLNPINTMMAICHVVFFGTSVFVLASEETRNNNNNNNNDLVDLTHYHVTTNVQSRLLKTTIDMTFRRRDDDDDGVTSDESATKNITNTTSSLQCNGPVIHTMTLQLPRLARVQSLEMDLSDGCQLDSQVQELEQAEDTFDNMASQGKPAAILTAWDMSNYKLQIILPHQPQATSGVDNSTSNVTLVDEEPPKPTTTVRLTYTELLVQKNHQVNFQLPVFPGMAVADSLKVDLTVQDSNAGILELNILNDDHDHDDTNNTATGNVRRKLTSNNNNNLAFHVTNQVDSKLAEAHFQESNLPEDSSIPRLVRGYFRPASLPEAGVLTIPLLEQEDKEEICFTHVFNPSNFLASAGSLPKNMVFVIDISGSMSGSRLENAKVAFASMVSALVDGKDAFTVQTFSSRGTESVYGPAMVNPTSKQQATQFVKSLQTSGSTNLHDAYLDGIGMARSMAGFGTAGAAVPILIVLSDGQASEGVTNRVDIARNVREANLEGQVKIFSLAFGSSADVDLLTGIALQNGGKVLRIYEGFGDTVLQMEDFYQKELEQIVLSDIDISYFKQDGSLSVGVASASASAAAASMLPLSVLDATSSSFPVLAGGSELIVRGKVARSDLPIDSNILQASISALSAVGNQDWSHQYDFSLPDLDDGGDNNAGNGPLIVNDCEQAFAHARIEELLNFRNAERALGDDLTTSKARASSASSFEEQALKIAVDAQLVWPGLTALVTVENPNCQQIVPQSDGNETQVCYSGENGLDGGNGGYYGEIASGGGSSRIYSGSAGLWGQTSSLWFITTLSSLVFVFLG